MARSRSPGLEGAAAPWPVDPAFVPLDGEDLHPGLGVQLQLAEGPPLDPAPGGDDRLGDDLVRLGQRGGDDRVGWPLVLDDAGHRLSGVDDALGGRGEVDQPPQLLGVLELGGRPQHPALELVVELVGLVLEDRDLGRQRQVAQEDRRVREADGHLGGVLELDDEVHRPVEVGQLGALRRRLELARRPAGELADGVDPVRWALQEQHVPPPGGSPPGQGRTASRRPGGSR
jgi:hypothetical protein